MPQPPDPGPTGPVQCSAKGCRSDATWVLVWANPRIHTDGRTKTWAACDEHRGSLGDFLGVRGFLREVVALPEWQAGQADR
ncbi:MAG: hypothetical protein ACTHOD_19105 [Motilibacteraceae bacterium]